MPSSQTRTQRKQRMQRGASKNTTGDHCFSGTWSFCSVEPALAGAVAERHVLQFALAALVAHRAVERMVGQQQFQHGLARLHALAGVSVLTTMPSATGSVQAVISFGIFSTSTRHMRQAACSVSPS